MPVTDQDVRDLIVAMDVGRANWINGGTEFSQDAPVLQADDMTLFAPFGGPGPRPGQVSPEVFAALQAAASVLFHCGDGSCEVVRTHTDVCVPGGCVAADET